MITSLGLHRHGSRSGAGGAQVAHWSTFVPAEGLTIHERRPKFVKNSLFVNSGGDPRRHLSAAISAAAAGLGYDARRQHLASNQDQPNSVPFH